MVGVTGAEAISCGFIIASLDLEGLIVLGCWKPSFDDTLFDEDDTLLLRLGVEGGPSLANLADHSQFAFGDIGVSEVVFSAASPDRRRCALALFII